MAPTTSLDPIGSHRRGKHELARKREVDTFNNTAVYLGPFVQGLFFFFFEQVSPSPKPFIEHLFRLLLLQQEPLAGSQHSVRWSEIGEGNGKPGGKRGGEREKARVKGETVHVLKKNVRKKASRSIFRSPTKFFSSSEFATCCLWRVASLVLRKPSH